MRPPRKIRKGIQQMLASDVVGCYVSDVMLPDPRATIVVDHPDEPGCFNVDFAYDEETHFDYWMGHRPTAFIKRHDRADDVATARLQALSWVGTTASEVPFRCIPGAYQKAFVLWALDGIELPENDIDRWWPVDLSAPATLMRNFPCLRYEDEHQHSGHPAMPAAVVERMFKNRGW